jgi:hypothetical protein
VSSRRARARAAALAAIDPSRARQGQSARKHARYANHAREIAITTARA